MGNSESHVPEEDLDPFDGIDTVGYRVLGVQPNSPASEAGLVSFLDFLVGAENKMLLGSGEGLEPGDEYDDIDLPALLNEYKGKEMELLVFNIKSQQARLVKLTPSDNWGGAGLLGVTIRLDNYAGAEDRLVRVLSVEPRSPAAVAGLVPEKDFLLGTTHQTFDSTAQLATVLNNHRDEVVELYVYNTDSDMVRVVALMPTLAWGGRGLLGAEVGTGYLHRLPASVRNTEGSSVERKVRYVGMTSPSSQSGLSKSNASRAILEVEPQLEMEPEPTDHTDEDDDSDVEEVYIQPSAVPKKPTKKNTATEEFNSTSSLGPPAKEVRTEEPTKSVSVKDVKTAPTVTSTKAGDERPPDSTVTASSSSTTSVQSFREPTVKPAPAVTSQIPAPVSAPMIPASGTSSTATAKISKTPPTMSPMLPPPPKMHYSEGLPKVPPT